MLVYGQGSRCRNECGRDDQREYSRGRGGGGGGGGAVGLRWCLVATVGASESTVTEAGQDG